MPRGDGRGRKPAGGAGDGRGRKRVPPGQAAQIQRRLREFLTREGQSTLAEFKKEPTFEAATVDGWFRLGRVPDVSNILRLAENYGLDPSHLLIGTPEPSESPSVGGAGGQGLEPALRQAVLASLTERFPEHRAVVRATVPWGSEILEEVVALYEEHVKKRLAKYPGQVRQNWFKKLIEEPDLQKRREMAEYVGPMLNLTGPLLSAPRESDDRENQRVTGGNTPNDPPAGSPQVDSRELP
jgi:hypothetical protein